MALNPLDFSILLVLWDHESYGYEIVQQLAEASSGGIRIAPGNLYYVLDRLQAEGWIRESGTRAVDGRQRTYYAITAAGRSVALKESERLRGMVPLLRRLAREAQ